MTAMEIKQADESARIKIRNELDTNFFVEAGAGSGKTTVLVDRMVNMVCAGKDISKICAITFTKAAASEFHDRFKKKLEEYAKNGDKICEAALKDIDLCFMGTIDSFCNMILSEHPSEAGIPSNARVMDEDAMKKLYRRKYMEIQRGEHGEELRNKCSRYRGFFTDPDQKFAEIVSTVMDRRNVHFNYIKPRAGTLDDVFADEKKSIVSVIKILSEHPEAENDSNTDSRKAWEYVYNDLRTLEGEWETNARNINYILKALSAIRIDLNWDISKLGMYADLFEVGMSRNKPAFYVFKKGLFGEEELTLPEIVSKKINNMQAAVCMDLVESAIPVIEKEFKAGGSLTFFDYLLYLRNMLKKDAEGNGILIQHIYDRHSYFLIDEFQDTNPLQAEIFFYLAAKKIDPDWRKCVPNPGSLFIVGDPKQSIYRFRDADVGAFQRVKELFTGDAGEALLLSCNFRSTNEMCGWFNKVFKELLPEDTKNQSAFPEIPIEENKKKTGNFSGIYYYDVKSGKDAAPEETDHMQVLDMIDRLVGNPNYSISEKGEPERMIRYSDFMIITPTKTRIPVFADTFIRNNIPFMVEGSTVFAECPAFVALSAIYDAVSAPNDTGKLFKALISNAIGITGSEILEYKNSGNSLNVFRNHSEEKGKAAKKINTALVKINELYQRAVNMTPAALYSVILDEFEIFKKTGVLNIEYVYYALELLRANEAAGVISSIEQASAFFTDLLNNEAGVERYLSLSRGADRVHIANLHKVKGLEAPIVILASPNKKAQTPSIRVEQTDNGPEGWIFSISKKEKENYSPIFSCSDYPDKLAEENESQMAETIRLLYVAATRARRALIISRMIKKDGTPTAGNAWSQFFDYCNIRFFDVFRNKNPNVRKARTIIEAEEVYKNAAPSIFGAEEPAKNSYMIKLPSRIRLKSVLSSEDDFEDAKEEEVRKQQSNKNPALVGTIVHRLMEVLVTSGNSVDLEKTIKEICGEYEDAGDTYYSDILRKVGTAVQNGGFDQVNGCRKDILSELLSAEERYCEVPFCYKEKDTDVIWNGVIDAIYKKDGKWHIIDYKTNLEADELDEKYQGQLQAYIRAFKEMTGEEADAQIYHIEV